MKRYISFSLFLIISIIAWWSITEYSGDNYQAKKASSSRYVEVFMNEFELTAMDDAGNPDYTLNGSHLQRFNDSDETEIKKPIIQLLRQSGQWKVSADNAVINNKEETIQLDTNVVMQQQNIEPAITFRTQSLLLDTKTQIAQTTQAVEIIQGISSIKSHGMIFNNMTHELELSSNVNGYYQPSATAE